MLAPRSTFRLVTMERTGSQAYAMAKVLAFCALHARVAQKEISDRKPNSSQHFYFQYGALRSIADLAHVAFAIESFLCWLPSPWSTSSAGTARGAPPRYQNFKRALLHTRFRPYHDAVELYTDPPNTSRRIRSFFGKP